MVELSQILNMKMKCHKHLNKPVQVQVEGQHSYSGIVEHVDDQYVYMMVPIDETGQYMDLAQLMQGMNAQSMYEYGHEQAYQHIPQQPLARQLESNQRYPFYPAVFPGYPGYYQPYPFYPYPYPYAPYPRPRGWNRLILPLAALTALAVL
jgi:small nuclear ribonucleoprotein (snRNP)-like protein